MQKTLLLLIMLVAPFLHCSNLDDVASVVLVVYLTSELLDLLLLGTML